MSLATATPLSPATTTAHGSHATSRPLSATIHRDRVPSRPSIATSRMASSLSRRPTTNQSRLQASSAPSQLHRHRAVTAYSRRQQASASPAAQSPPHLLCFSFPNFSRIQPDYTLKSQATSERCGRCDFDGEHPTRWKSDPGGQLLDRSAGYVLRSSRSQVRALEAIFVNLVQLSPDVRLRGTPVGRLGKILTSRRCGSHSNISSSPSLHTLYGAHYHTQVKRKGPETRCL